MPNIDRPTTGLAMADALIRSWRALGEPWLATGSFNLAGGGYVQWTRVADADTEMLVEINEGGDYTEAMPADLVARLVAMGWEDPDDQFRNCWAMVHPADVDRLERVGQLALDGAELVDTRNRPRSALIPSADGRKLTAGGRIRWRDRRWRAAHRGSRPRRRGVRILGRRPHRVRVRTTPRCPRGGRAAAGRGPGRYAAAARDPGPLRLDRRAGAVPQGARHRIELLEPSRGLKSAAASLLASGTERLQCPAEVRPSAGRLRRGGRPA